MDRPSAFGKVEAHVAGLVADLAARLVDHLRRLTVEVDELAAEITSRTAVLAPSLLAIPGCGALAAARERGRFGGRPSSLTPAKKRLATKMKGEGVPMAEIAEVLNVTRSTLCRNLK